MIALPVTLVTAGASVFVNSWLGMRIASLRYRLRVTVGDGGQEPLVRRMRAQANFIEHAPFFLILLAALELADANRLALAVIAGLFILARIAHGVGMDGGPVQRWRRDGILASNIASGALAVWALVCAAQLCLGR
jgi:uncharacterized membrane protein YecN with MAPEG domain